MREKRVAPLGVQESGVKDLCRKLKEQLDQLSVEFAQEQKPSEDVRRRGQLLERLKAQLNELSS